MFASRGESGPPCGVPSSLACTNPSTIAPRRRYLPIKCNTRLSRTTAAIRPITNVVVDVVEEPGDVYIHHPFLPSLRVLLCGSHGVLCASSRSEPVTMLTELRLEYRCQHLQQQLLNEPILYRGDSQRPCSSA